MVLIIWINDVLVLATLTCILFIYLFISEDIKSISLGAIWSFSRATALPWFWYGEQRALGASGPWGPVPKCNHHHLATLCLAVACVVRYFKVTFDTKVPQTSNSEQRKPNTLPAHQSMHVSLSTGPATLLCSLLSDECYILHIKKRLGVHNMLYTSLTYHQVELKHNRICIHSKHSSTAPPLDDCYGGVGV